MLLLIRLRGAAVSGLPPALQECHLVGICGGSVRQGVPTANPVLSSSALSPLRASAGNAKSVLVLFDEPNKRRVAGVIEIFCREVELFRDYSESFCTYIIVGDKTRDIDFRLRREPEVETDKADGVSLGFMVGHSCECISPTDM